MSSKSRRKATLSHNRFHFSCKARTDVSVEEPTRDVCSRGSDGLLSLHKWQAWRFLLIAVAARTHILQASASRPKMWRQFMWRHVDMQGRTLFIQAARTPGRVRGDFLSGIFLSHSCLQDAVQHIYPERRAERCHLLAGGNVGRNARLFINLSSQSRNNLRRNLQTFRRDKNCRG